MDESSVSRGVDFCPEIKSQEETGMENKTVAD